MTQGAYHLISISLLLVCSYLLSLLSVKKQWIPRQRHRRFWNLLLLFFFLSTALLGLLLAVRVNYKLNMTWLDTAMKWHVETGIALAWVALFHLSWHLSYYLRPAKVPVESDQLSDLAQSFPNYKLWFLLLGYVSMMAQLLLLREFLKTFHGNELLIGIFLALWMVLSATGARHGARAKVTFKAAGMMGYLLILALFPLLINMALIGISRYVFLPGLEPGLFTAVSWMLGLTAPFALVSGFLFAYSCTKLSSAADPEWDRPYRLDALGSLLGGGLFSLVLVFLLNNLQVMAFLLLSVALGLNVAYKYPTRPVRRYLLLSLCLALFAILLFPGTEEWVENGRYRDETLRLSRDTPHGNLSVTERDGQLNAYLDRNPVTGPDNLPAREELIHFAALQHPHPRSFLLLGASLSGAALEAEKYRPQLIHCCEPDPRIFRLGKSLFDLELPDSFQLIPSDGRSWLMKAESPLYDVIISAAGDPSTLGWNRYYTTEFFQHVQSHLGKNGVFAMKLDVGGNYINQQGQEVLAVNYYSLKSVFREVLILPGEHSWFLASAQKLTLDYAGLLERHPVVTSWVHPDYLDLEILSFESELILEGIKNTSATLNTDLWPQLFFHSIRARESMNNPHSLLISGSLAILVFLVLLVLYPYRKRAMYLMGFSGAGIQILIILLMQVVSGYAYMLAPLMITLFMGGIVLGSLSWKMIWGTASSIKLLALVLMMALLSAILFGLTSAGGSGSSWISSGSGRQLLLGILNFLPGLMVGSVYGLGLALWKRDQEKALIPGPEAGLLFSADLAGAALGSFIAPVFLLPLIGVNHTFLLFFGINLLMAVNILVNRKRQRY